MRIISLLLLSLIWALSILPAGAVGKSQPDRIYPCLKIPEACDRAERENLPICFCYLGKFPPDSEPAGLERVWKDNVNLLATECIVVACRQPEKGSFDFANLVLRTTAASLEYNIGGVIMVDPWQETRLGEAMLNYHDTMEPDTKKRMLPSFSKNVEGMLKTATEWNKAQALKPESWKDAKDRTMTATAVSWDGKTAVFRLPTGKTASLPAATLSADSLERLAKIFRPQVPWVNASDPADLEAHLGQQVCVVGREERVNPTYGEETTGKVVTHSLYFSRFFGMKYSDALHEEFRKNSPNQLFRGRGRVYGILEKETSREGILRYVIKITKARDFGPGAVVN